MIEGPIYACGDIHGRLDLLEKFLTWVGDDSSGSSTVVFLGDYVDRGPHSRGVIERLMAGPTRSGERWYPIKGNHESLLVSAWLAPQSRHAEMWLMCGGSAALRSYSNEADIRDIPEEHVRFLDSLPLGYDDGERLYVHAGVRPGVPMWAQAAHDLLWIRDPFLGEPHDIPRLVIHGHTPRDLPDIRPWRVGLDVGAYRANRLAAARFLPGIAEPRFWLSEP
ncbi:metallophosphoesterase family protein [Methylobacterium trifolii]|nr:metallophosphoesterase family protein [Methylobacterium trifolii]